MTIDPADADEVTELENEGLRNLGLVTQWSATMEYMLREAFCSLVGSKYAAVVAGGQGTDWLIQNCRAIVKVHREIADEHRSAILTALTDCEKANNHRNTLVHGLKTAMEPDGTMTTIRSRRGRHLDDHQAWTPEELAQAADALIEAGGALTDAMRNAVDPKTMAIGAALAWEEYYDNPPKGPITVIERMFR